MKNKVDPIIPEVCDRLNCKVESCYGWDLCRQAREECTENEWKKFYDGFVKLLENCDKKKS